MPSPGTLLLITVLLAVAAPAAADDYGLTPDHDFLRAQVREPVFAMIFAMVQADSLGTWSRADVEAFSADWGRPSDFPLDRLVSIERRVAPPAHRARRRDRVCDRLITVTLTEPRLDMPMPYSILGYHPGGLSFGSPLMIREWRLGDVSIHVRAKDGSRREDLAGFTVFQIVEGWAVLDVDGWLDNLLGRNLDDSATLAFSTGRAGGRILGVGSSVGRDGRSIYGELDFRRGTVVTHGRPMARAMSSAARPYTLPDEGDRNAAWDAYDGDQESADQKP